MTQNHACVFSYVAKAVGELVKDKAVGAASLAERPKLEKPRAIWLMSRPEW
jgi:6-phosphogluconate dehydrogenase (decarboxylating)